MPWLAVEKTYQFEGPEGTVSLLDLLFRTVEQFDPKLLFQLADRR